MEVWELKLYFYPSAGGLKKKKKKKHGGSYRENKRLKRLRLKRNRACCTAVVDRPSASQAAGKKKGPNSDALAVAPVFNLVLCCKPTPLGIVHTFHPKSCVGCVLHGLVWVGDRLTFYQ